jgi:hypothetical protein
MSLPVEIANRIDGWYAAGITYLSLGIFLALLGILTSTAVAVFTSKLSENKTKALSFVAAISTALTAYFSPIDIGSRFLEAWRLLDSAIIHYKTEPAKYGIETVTQALDKGEAILAGVPKFGQQTAPGQAASAPIKK